MQMLVYRMLGRPYHSHRHSCPGINRNMRKRCWGVGGSGGCRQAGKGPEFPTAAQFVLIQKVEATGENPEQHSEVAPLMLTFSDSLFNLKGKVWHFGEYTYLHHICDCWVTGWTHSTTSCESLKHSRILPASVPHLIGPYFSVVQYSPKLLQ